MMLAEVGLRSAQQYDHTTTCRRERPPKAVRIMRHGQRTQGNMDRCAAREGNGRINRNDRISSIIPKCLKASTRGRLLIPPLLFMLRPASNAQRGQGTTPPQNSAHASFHFGSVAGPGPFANRELHITFAANLRRGAHAYLWMVLLV